MSHLTAPSALTNGYPSLNQTQGIQYERHSFSKIAWPKSSTPNPESGPDDAIENHSQGMQPEGLVSPLVFQLSLLPSPLLLTPPLHRHRKMPELDMEGLNQGDDAV
jgi:hypothetical protein